MKMKERLAEIGHNIATQDERITSHALFAVMEKRRIYGLTNDYSHKFEWVHRSGGEPFGIESGPMFDWLESDCALYTDKCVAPEDRPDSVQEEEWNYGNWERIYYDEIDVFVTACFTEHGCNEYLRINKHNLTSPFTYVFSAYRNQEWIDMRAFLLSQQKETDGA